MLQKNTGAGIPLSKMEDGAFFRVRSPTATEQCPEYLSQCMISLHDQQLPPDMRLDDGSSALFLLVHVGPVPMRATEIVVREVDYDLTETTRVEHMSPVGEIPNGAYLMLADPEVETIGPQCRYIGGIDSQGRLKVRRRRGKMRRRGGQGPTRH